MYRMLRLRNGRLIPELGAGFHGDRSLCGPLGYSPAICEDFEMFAFTSEMTSRIWLT